MYVCGRGTNTFGTVLPAIIKLYKTGLIEKVYIACKNKKSFIILDEKLSHLKKYYKVDFKYVGYPKNENKNENAYLDALADLPDPSAVIIATPDHTHFTMAEASIKNGKHILVVKPLVPKVSEAIKLVELLKESKLYGAVEFHKRFDLANQHIKYSINEGQIGDPLYCHVEYSQPKFIPESIFANWISHTNIFQYLGVHYADIIYYTTKSTPTRLLSVGQKKYLVSKGIDTYDSIQTIIEWSSGLVSTILTSWVDPNCSPAISQQKIKWIGTAGRFESDQTNRGVSNIIDNSGYNEINPYFCNTYYDNQDDSVEYKGYGIDSIQQFIYDVISVVTKERKPNYFEGKRPTFRESIISTSIVEGVNLSLENNGSWVEINDKSIPYLK